MVGFSDAGLSEGHLVASGDVREEISLGWSIQGTDLLQSVILEIHNIYFAILGLRLLRSFLDHKWKSGKRSAQLAWQVSRSCIDLQCPDLRWTVRT